MYFEIKYRGKSSEDFNAVIFTNNTDTHNSGLTRTVTKGVISDINLFPSYSYAVFNNDFSFNLQMFKKDNTVFSEGEKRKINSWLTSCKYSSELEIIYKDCKGNEQSKIFYKGHFTDVTYEIGNGGIVILKTVFSSDTPYGYIKNTLSLSSDETEHTFEIDSDVDDYIYPTITLSWTGDEDMINLLIKNDNAVNSAMNINLYKGIPAVIDCERMVIKSDSYKFSDLGWNETGDMNWLRLINGTNTIITDHACDVTLDYKIPIKAGEPYEF